MDAETLKAELAAHVAWLRDGENGKRANLTGAYLTNANLTGADLRGAYLRGAYLTGADLTGADLRGADLRGADMRGAYLTGADLTGADLTGADLRGADLRGADMRGAYLTGADLTGAKLPHFQIPDGDLIGWGKKGGRIVKMRIPPEAKRTGSLIGRKCRAEWVEVLEIEGADETTSERGGTYCVGEITRPDSYNDDPRVECTNGVHFFLTRAEAEEW